MKQIKGILLKSLLGIAGLLVLFSSSVVSVQAEEAAIAVQAVLPENQITKDAGYYDLMVAPGQEQTLLFKLYNRSNESKTVNIAINPAFTGDSGSFVYTQDASKKDESLKVSLSEIAKTDKVVSIPAKGDTVIPIHLMIPKEPFQGIILGAIRVTEAGEKETPSDEAKKEGFAVTNKLAYSVAIQLREKDEMPKSNLVLKKVTVGQVAGRNLVKAQLQNPTPTIIDEVSYEAVVMKKDSPTVLHKKEVENYRVAPNSSFSLPISWDNQPFKAGEYTIRLTAKSKKNKEEWSFKQDFVISPEEAKKLNAQAVDLETDYWPYVLYGGIAVSLLIIFSSVLVWRSRKKKRQKQKERESKKKKKKRPSSQKNSKGENRNGRTNQRPVGKGNQPARKQATKKRSEAPGKDVT